jgi:hypothetical protein
MGFTQVKVPRLTDASGCGRNGGDFREKVGFIPRGWNLFFSGTGTADFHPEVLEKARPISPLAEIRQNNARKNCGKDLNSTPWFAPFYCLFVCNQSRDY